MTRSDFSFSINGDIVTVQDLNLGRMSVTNDAENVIKELHEQIDLTGKRVQYYDSEGQLDRLLHKDGVFAGFRPGPWEKANV